MRRRRRPGGFRRAARDQAVETGVEAALPVLVEGAVRVLLLPLRFVGRVVARALDALP